MDPPDEAEAEPDGALDDVPLGAVLAVDVEDEGAVLDDGEVLPDEAGAVAALVEPPDEVEPLVDDDVEAVLPELPEALDDDPALVPEDDDVLPEDDGAVDALVNPPDEAEPEPDGALDGVPLGAVLAVDVDDAGAVLDDDDVLPGEAGAVDALCVDPPDEVEPVVDDGVEEVLPELPVELGDDPALVPEDDDDVLDVEPEEDEVEVEPPEPDDDGA